MGALLGAYLKKPNTEKISTDEDGRAVICGASSMQGWRITQEDAHNCTLDYDTNAYLFAVYDGHGGHEVATYSALHLPQYLKNCEAYKRGDYTEALKDAFLEFDATLTTAEVVAELKEIQKSAHKDGEIDSESDEEEENVKNLYEEAEMPLEEVMAKYKNDLLNIKEKSKDEAGRSGASSSGARASSSKCSKSQISESENGSADSDEDSNEKKEGDSEVSSSSNQAQSSGISSSTSKQQHSDSNADQASESSSNSSNGDTKLVKEIDTTKNKETMPDSSGDAKIQKTDDKSGDGDSTVKGGDAGDVKQEVNGETGEKQSKTSKDSEGVTSSSTPRENGEVVAGEGKGKAKVSANVEEKRNVPILRRRDAAALYRTLLRNHENMDSDSDDDDDEGDESFQGVDNSSDEDNEDAEGEENEEGDEEEEDDEDDDDDEENEDEEDDESMLDDEEEEDDDARISEKPGLDSGCTAVVALLKGRELYVANAGDSRCVVCRKGEAIEMSLDHKPEDAIEQARIVKAGGTVNMDGRVNGGLNLSRALGDHAYKQSAGLSAQEQMITALPDVRTLMIDPQEDEFMILACDGIWNSLSSQDVVDFVRPRIKEGTKLSQICEELFDHCLAPDTMGDGTGCDNMTAVIVQFKQELANVSEKRARSPSSEPDSGRVKQPKLEETEKETASV